MSSEDEDERRLQDVFKTSSSRRIFAGLFLETVTIKVNRDLKFDRDIELRAEGREKQIPNCTSLYTFSSQNPLM